jgi:hypothetical protein
LRLGKFFGMADSSSYFSLRVALGERLAAVLLLATFGEG